jgi:4-amino-4-deoxy-L-arabinose transferase-like glycosyltransferase
MEVIVPLIVALSGLPALAVAAWIGGADDPRSRGLGLRWALLGMAILLGAAALYWAGDSRPRVYAVAIALVIAVNALAVSMVRHLRRGNPGPSR